jgi:SAM-dependent methyltransferase
VAPSQERLATSGAAWARLGAGTVALCAAVLVIGAVSSCRAPAQPPSPDAAPGALDEAAIKRMAQALFDAYDRADPDRFAEAVGPAFVLIDDGRATDRGSVISEIRARRDRHAPDRSRTIKNENVWMGGSSAVFFGESVEHFLPDGPKIVGDLDGYVTLVWTNDGGNWKAASWQWIQGGLAADRAEWNTAYTDSLAGRAPTGTGRWYNPEPNAFLVEMVRARKPGFALDVAMGQGRNALYLASKGWRVTGIDISDEALREARMAAADRGLRIDAQNVEAAAWNFGTAQWDLVTFVYAAGCPRPSQDGACGAAIIEKLRKGLKPGGLVVVEGPHKDTRPWGFATGELSALFKGDFTILHDDVVDDVSDWGNQTGIKQKLVRFAATKD